MENQDDNAQNTENPRGKEAVSDQKAVSEKDGEQQSKQDAKKCGDKLIPRDPYTANNQKNPKYGSHDQR